MLRQREESPEEDFNIQKEDQIRELVNKIWFKYDVDRSG